MGRDTLSDRWVLSAPPLQNTVGEVLHSGVVWLALSSLEHSIRFPQKAFPALIPSSSSLPSSPSLPFYPLPVFPLCHIPLSVPSVHLITCSPAPLCLPSPFLHLSACLLTFSSSSSSLCPPSSPLPSFLSSPLPPHSVRVRAQGSEYSLAHVWGPE